MRKVANEGLLARAAFWAILLVVALGHVVAVFTENVNWDEFALFARAERAARTGVVGGGGRPGLGTLVLVPLARGCSNTVHALAEARLGWTLLVGASGVAFWFLLRAVVPRSRHAWAATATGVGLWVLAPAFLRYSLQVRTDQPAILFGLLGGLALVASRRRLPWAPAAGVLFAVGFLFSQKLLYVGGLVGVLAAGQLLLRQGELHLRRDALRVLLTGGVFLIVALGYREVMGRVAGTPTMLPVAGQLRTFEYYRAGVGWRYYRLMLPTLLPHLLLLGSLVAVTLAWVRARDGHGRELLVAWGVVLTGAVVAVFHAARFPYFYLVLGLFPAAAGALVVGPVLARLRSRTGRRTLMGLVWVPLALGGLLQTALLTIDTQARQRASVAFVHESFPASARGFDGYGIFRCRHDPDPFPVFFH